MRASLLGRWMSTASVAAGTVLIAFSLGATPGMDRTLAASTSTTSPSTLRATAVSPTFISHDGDGDGDTHGHDGHAGGWHGHDGREI